MDCGEAMWYLVQGSGTMSTVHVTMEAHNVIFSLYICR